MPRINTSLSARYYERRKVKEKKPLSTGSRARKARIRGMVKNFSKQEWMTALDYFDHRCAYCWEKGRLQQEHFLPVNMNGDYTARNIIPACAKCNSKKSDKDPFEFLMSQEHGVVAYLRIGQYFTERHQPSQETPG